jgi:hypothetical protein
MEDIISKAFELIVLLAIWKGFLFLGGVTED